MEQPLKLFAYLLVLGFDTVQSYASWCVVDVAVYVAISVDPEQTPHSMVSDLGLHCCKGLSDPVLEVAEVICLTFKPL